MNRGCWLCAGEILAPTKDLESTDLSILTKPPISSGTLTKHLQLYVATY